MDGTRYVVCYHHLLYYWFDCWVVTNKSSSGLYTWLEHIQLFTILPLAGSYFNSEVILVNTAGIDELNNYSDRSHRWSWWLTWFILFVFTFMFSCTVLYAILSKSHKDLNESNVYRELVSGLTTNRMAKLYSPMFIIHRILVVIFMTIDMGLSTKIKLIVYGYNTDPFSLIFSSTGPAKSTCTLNPMPASSSISISLAWKFDSVMVP